MKLLAIGDMHLGRCPKWISKGSPFSPAELGASATWRRIVDQAIQWEVDVVVFAGDVVESEKDFFEAYRALYEGIKKLKKHGIRAFGVAGNHDFSALPRLAEKLTDFTLLGKGGVWEKLELDGITLHGYSFPTKQVKTNPLRGVYFTRGPGLNIGLLHCDRDRSDTQTVYAPVFSKDLVCSPLDYWLLGHIHRPDALSIDQGGYLGCVTSMDADDVGDLGPWLYVIEHGAIASVTHWVLAPFRVEMLRMDLSYLVEREKARDLLLEQVTLLDKKLKDRLLLPPKVIHIRVQLEGSTHLGSEVQTMFEKEREKPLFTHRDTSYFMAHCKDFTHPEIALGDCARTSDPPGLLAKLLLSLENLSADEKSDFVDRAVTYMNQIAAKRHWGQPLGNVNYRENRISREEAVDLLKRSGLRLLKEMLDQKRGV